MPIYEYVCMTCESHFEELVRGDEQPPCPDCGATKVARQFSVFATRGESPQPSFRSAGGGGGCCGGSCGCCH
jgi:putative FmdB family regulatory protein